LSTTGLGGGALRVGVRHLPKHLSPAQAWTPSELRAVELLFEGLVKLSPDGEGGWQYRPGLAEGRPIVKSLGREFRLPRNALWSDGKPVRAEDVRFTVEELRKDGGTARPMVWGDMLSPVELEGESSRVRVLLRQGHPDPLSLLAFKLVPEHRSPVGSGPYVYAGAGVAGPGLKQKRLLRFEASPHYGDRPGKQGLPAIGEVQLIGLADEKGAWDKEAGPVQALQAGELDVALDLSAAEAAALRGKAGGVVPKAAPNRRVYFLAVDHTKRELSNANLRLALARAIDREKLLDDHFRGPLKREAHKALNGPYPAGSWACNPDLTSRADRASLDPYDPDRARSKFKQALTELRQAGVALELKYPTGDPDLEEAIGALCKQVEAVFDGKLKLAPKGRSPWQLRDDVEVRRDYELAYYHHDFLDGTFWLMPLLGPSGPKHRGRNYLGYAGPLVGRARAAASWRNFERLRQHAHALHRDFLNSEMPFVPLWQLDPLLAYRANVKVVPFDPLRVFTDVEQWRLEGR
jgi:ABC-type oligopeptide transport system substrate-binding subunit